MGQVYLYVYGCICLKKGSARVHHLLLVLLVVGTLFSAEITTSAPIREANTSVITTVESTDDFNEEDAFAESFEAEEFGDDEGFDDDAFNDEFAVEKTDEVFDPLSGYNRLMTGFNDGLYSYVLSPVLFKGYNLLPEQVRVSVNNVFENLYYPVSVVNNVLQLKFQHTGTETFRFVVNSTLGILGIFDPASSWFGFEAHKEDFGQTLGYYGVGSGFHIVLPFFGPTNLRDFAGDLIDFYVNPIYYVDARKYNVVNNVYQGWGLVGYKEFNKMSLYTKEYENVREDALDLYPFMRDLYEQSREKKIKE